jgi:FkbH-like protein
MDNERTIVIASTFTPDPMRDAIQYWLERLELPGQIVFAPQNQVLQTLLDPTSLFCVSSALNVVLLRWQDLDPGERRGDSPLTVVTEALRSSSARSKAPHLVISCPNVLSAEDAQRQQRYTEWDHRLGEVFREHSNIYLVTSDFLQTHYPAGTVYDFYGDRFAAIPYSPAMYAAIGTMIARSFHMLTTEPYKAIVVDCDDSLWSGACGEVGPEGVVLDASRMALHEFLVAQSLQGVLICLCSKNNPEDVEAVFRERIETQRLVEHLVCRRINWASKAENVLSIASELGLGTESFMFLDDNPVECEGVRQALPKVLTLQLPPDPNEIPRWLQRVWAFDRPFPTREDRERREMYQQARQREELHTSSASLEEFLANLQVKITRVPLDQTSLPRASQLTFRVNQFNLTTVRRTEAELDALLRQQALSGFLVDVSDRYGEYGLVGLVLYRSTADGLCIDTLLLSCRALGRGVEHRIVADLAALAKSSGLEFIELRLVPTSKNQPARDFLTTSLAPYERRRESYLEYRVPVDAAISIRYRPSQENTTSDREPDGSSVVMDRGPVTSARGRELALMASEPVDADGILGAIQDWHRKDSYVGTDFVPARNELEEMLADLWMEVLGLEKVGVRDNFFALGGDSLKMVRVIVRLYAQTGIEFPIAAFFETPIIEAHAAKLNSFLSR